MLSNRAELTALKNLITQADRILATAPQLPENRTAAARESLAAALALADDLLRLEEPALPLSPWGAREALLLPSATAQNTIA
jgi:hypothetical protein